MRLWEVDTGRELHRVAAHGSWVNSVAFSPDGRTLASVDDDKTVRLWEVATGRELRSLAGQASRESSMAFSPDGRTVALSDGAGGIRLWSLANGQLTGLLLGGLNGWLSQLRAQPVFRHDDGHFLYRELEDGRLEPVPPPRRELEPRLSAQASLQTVPGDFGDAGELALTVANEKGAGRAYWIRLEPVELPPGLVLIPPSPLMSLEAGESVPLRVGLSYLRPEGAPFPDSSKTRLKLVLKLVHAFGEGPTLALPLQLKSPELKLEQEPRIEDKVLTVILENTGTQSTGPLVIRGAFGPPSSTPQTEQTSNEQASAQRAQTLVLEPGQQERVPFAIPETLRPLDTFSFQLTANHERWPREWSFSAPEVRVPVPYALYGVLLLGAVLLFSGVYFARVYRHPVVVQAAATPALLKTYPLADMERADLALRRAGRRDATLTAASIPLVRWELLLRGARHPAEVAAAFTEALGGRLGAPLGERAWALELPPLRLRFTRQTALLVLDGPRVESGEAQRMMMDVFQDGRGPSQVLVLDRTQTQNAAQVLKELPQVRAVILSAPPIGSATCCSPRIPHGCWSPASPSRSPSRSCRPIRCPVA